MIDRGDPPRAWSLSTLLLLADGRFPAGGHAHSGGLEAAVSQEGLRDVAGLESFLHGRAATTGAVAAAFAAAACAALSGNAAGPEAATAVLGQLDRELEARIPSPALRAASGGNSSGPDAPSGPIRAWMSWAGRSLAGHISRWSSAPSPRPPA